MSAGLIFALLVAIATFAWCLDRSLDRVRAAQARFRALMAKRQAQVDRIKKAALQTLYLKRERSQMRRTHDGLTQDSDRMETQIRDIARPENRVFVMDERRMPADQGWIVLVEAPAGGRSTWTGNRRFLVWAADEETARGKAARKFAEDKGFRVGAISPRAKQPAAPAGKKAAAG